MIRISRSRCHKHGRLGIICLVVHTAPGCARAQPISARGSRALTPSRAVTQCSHVAFATARALHHVALDPRPRSRSGGGLKASGEFTFMPLNIFPRVPTSRTHRAQRVTGAADMYVEIASAFVELKRTFVTLTVRRAYRLLNSDTSSRTPRPQIPSVAAQRPLVGRAWGCRLVDRTRGRTTV
jgi:hypothetical protein